ncbi:ABC transporter ATP-binding protein [Candidatus Woesearchaeota archaeon]|nr:ABC transporter ATP-binding protein [Candidatus Woesearchaeota archaeon]
MKAISIKNLYKSYPGVDAIKGISFDIEEGDFFGFLGPNGAGKTTTINCIIGLAQFSQGNIEVFGKDVKKDYMEARKFIGTSPQEYNFDPYLSIADVLIYQAGYYGIKKKDVMPKVEELLKQFKLDGKSEVDFRKLSGGMKRRLTLARSLVHDPKVLILDEPTAGVDVELRIELHNYLKKINKDGKTILLTSHYIDEVEKLCDTICIINEGKIIANEKTKNLLDRLDDGHTEIITDKVSKKIDLDCVEFNKNKILVWNRGKHHLKEVFAHLQKQNIKVIDIKTVKDSLQNIFLRLTKK